MGYLGLRLCGVFLGVCEAVAVLSDDSAEDQAVPDGRAGGRVVKDCEDGAERGDSEDSE